MNDSGQHQFLVDEELLHTGPRPYGFIVHDQSHPFGAWTFMDPFMGIYGWRAVFIRAPPARRRMSEPHLSVNTSEKRDAPC